MGSLIRSRYTSTSRAVSWVPRLAFYKQRVPSLEQLLGMAKVRTLNSLKLITPEQALEQIFSTIASAEVKAELRKWHAFGLTGEGRNLHQLPPEQLSLFIHKLQDLSLALYAQQQEAQKGEDHEP